METYDTCIVPLLCFDMILTLLVGQCNRKLNEMPFFRM